MIHLPFEIKLFTQTWLCRAAQPNEIGTDLGQCRSDQMEILLNPNQSAESMLHTLMHELTHCIEIKMDLEFSERQVDLMALGIINLLRDNPMIFDIIKDEQ